jgi:hypothetical protein
MLFFVYFRLANIHFNRLASILLFVGTLLGCAGVPHRKEGMIQVLAGLVPSSQKVGFLMKTPGQLLTARKFLVLN